MTTVEIVAVAAAIGANFPVAGGGPSKDTAGEIELTGVATFLMNFYLVHLLPRNYKQLYYLSTTASLSYIAPR